MQRIRKGDTVQVLTGKDKGRTGEVLRVIPAEQRVLVRGINMVKRHRKPQMGDPVGRAPRPHQGDGAGWKRTETQTFKRMMPRTGRSNG